MKKIVSLLCHSLPLTGRYSLVWPVMKCKNNNWMKEVRRFPNRKKTLTYRRQGKHAWWKGQDRRNEKIWLGCAYVCAWIIEIVVAGVLIVFSIWNACKYAWRCGTQKDVFAFRWTYLYIWSCLVLVHTQKNLICWGTTRFSLGIATELSIHIYVIWHNMYARVCILH